MANDLHTLETAIAGHLNGGHEHGNRQGDWIMSARLAYDGTAAGFWMYGGSRALHAAVRILNYSKSQICYKFSLDEPS